MTAQIRIRPPNPMTGVLPAVADTLEGKLLPVNTDSALRQPPSSATQVGKGVRLEQTEKRVEKNKREKSKRDRERSQLERIGYFFKVAEPRKCWTRTELLSFGEIFFPCMSNRNSPHLFQLSSTSSAVLVFSRKVSFPMRLPSGGIEK